jgi:hypothetical protein
MFVTLTDKTVCGRNLASALSNRTKCLSNVIRTLKKRFKSNIKAIRKIEITYNQQTNEYHPHIHILVDGDLIATEIVKEWLKRNRTATNDAQDITQANQNSLIELFKYTTKLVTKNGINPKAQDLIFNVLRRKRTIQTYGIKRQCDKIDEYDTTEITFKRPQIEIFKFDKYDWVSAYGEVFSEYEPSNETIELINKLHLQNR